MSIPYLYKWTQLSTGKWYIGSKSSKNCDPLLHEKYICSSTLVKPLVIESRDDWIYEILVIGPAKYIRNLESKYLKLLNAKNDSMSYNRSNASCEYDRTGIKESNETRLKKSLARQGDKNPSFGKRGPLSPLYGRKHSAETKEKQSSGLKEYSKNRPEDHNTNISKALKGNPKVGLKGEKNPSYGRPEVADRINSLPPKTCEHCSKTISLGNYSRWHGDNCRSRK